MEKRNDMKQNEILRQKIRKQERLGLILRKYCKSHETCKGCKFDHFDAWCYKDETAKTLPLEELEAAMEEIS